MFAYTSAIISIYQLCIRILKLSLAIVLHSIILACTKILLQVIVISMLAVLYDVPCISEARNLNINFDPKINISVLYRPLLQAIRCPKKTLRPSPRGHKMVGQRWLKQRREKALQRCPWRKSRTYGPLLLSACLLVAL
jgi:hypothetical protein